MSPSVEKITQIRGRNPMWIRYSLRSIGSLFLSLSASLQCWPHPLHPFTPCCFASGSCSRPLCPAIRSHPGKQSGRGTNWQTWQTGPGSAHLKICESPIFPLTSYTHSFTPSWALYTFFSL
ncbi:hypothetical protein K432DRAFT_186471 [Lepidopterella palustris CBS 459.81]|uniref:Uncharacterized protein n=1 Tax=Lepidopterella palustris CBS 459.81 TaxID=1314670 RepID=A0A8E2EL09_9PEZI|nr:hypothetical protein K432DRAFT_186471 [Lepidopterella palustris CBS 459.81]